MSKVLTPLCELALKYGTDKGGWHQIAGETCHNYTPYYHAAFRRREPFVERVLEIGVNYGPSLRMWEEYFPNAAIIGLDSNAECLFNAGRIRCYAADQNRPSDLVRAINEAVPNVGRSFDLIVDDGSHVFDHQIVSMLTLLPYLKDNGVYVIEDIALDCQPQLFFPFVPDNYFALAVPTGIGIGKARCDENCPKCHGSTGENLIMVTRTGS